MTDRIFILDQGRHTPTLVTDLSETFWTAPASFARTGDTTFTVTDNAANQALFKRYKPVRYRDTGVYLYGVILSYSTGTVTISGPTLPNPLNEVEVGPSYKTNFIHVNATGSMSVTANVLDDVNFVRSKLVWTSPVAYLVYARGYAAVAAVGANLLVDIDKNTNNVLSLNLGTATTVVASTTINSSNYELTPDDDIQVEITQIGSTTPGEDLSVYLMTVTP